MHPPKNVLFNLYGIFSSTYHSSVLKLYVEQLISKTFLISNRMKQNHLFRFVFTVILQGYTYEKNKFLIVYLFILIEVKSI